MRGTNFALLGCSHPHSRWHLSTLRLMPEIDGVWVWDPDKTAAEAISSEAGHLLQGVTDDLNALLHRDDVEWVLIASRNDVTPELVIRAAWAGKQILCEKQMAVSAEALAPALKAVAQ